MKIGIQTGYWSRRPPKGIVPALVAGEALGLDSVWTAEAYGSDAFTPLAWWGSHTRKLRLGTGIAQMAARTPTATAMQAITLDHLSGGRFVLGLGASGPQVVEGWYGQPYARPLARTREYVAIVREVFAREKPVALDGEFFQLPLSADAPGATGLGKALKPTVHPYRQDLPIVLAAQGPKNIALAAEIADGWMAGFYAPRLDDEFRGLLADGFSARSGQSSERTPDDFEVLATVPVVVRNDLEQAADVVRPHLALYVGGMGAKGANFHKQSLDRLGYQTELDDVQELYLAGRKDEAAKAIPVELIEEIALIGNADKVTKDLARWQDTAVDTMLIQGDPASMLSVLAAVQEQQGGNAAAIRAKAATLLSNFAPSAIDVR